MIYRALFIGLLTLLCPLSAAESTLKPLLSTQDVTKVLSKIFAEHLTHKKMDGEIMRRSVLLFVNQFDPDRSYLLAAEAGKFMNLTDAKTAQLINEFNKNNYSFFRGMEEEFGKAILRARDIRKKFTFTSLRSITAEYEKSARDSILNELAPFPQQIEDLEARIRVKLVRLIYERAASVANIKNPPSFDEVVSQVQNDLIEFENSYLGVGADGKPLVSTAREDLFSFHVLKAVTASLDAHSSFLNQKEAKSLKMELQRGFDGIGIVLQEKGGSITISRMIAGAPAEKCGQLQPGDVIQAINGKSVENQPLDEAVELLQGQLGTKVSLQVRRKVSGQDKLITVSLTREKVLMQEGRVDTNFVNVKGGIIGEITLHAFYEGGGASAADDVKKAILDLQKQGPIKGLIFDLRDNRGGFLMQAVKVAGLFMKTGVVVMAKTQDGKEQFYRDIDPSIAYDGPLIVLTSRATASAAEIVAEALKDYGIALVVGDEKTYGKGSIQSQTVTDGRNDPALKVTVGQYYSVSGNSTQLEGVKADIVVPSVFFEARLGEEYLNFPIEVGELAPAFDDKLQGIAARDKAWYIKYYLPNLQKRRYFSKEELDTLRAKSLKRILANDEYQEYLMSPPASLSTKRSEETPLQKRVWELQMEEAVNIMKDMIQ